MNTNANITTNTTVTAASKRKEAVFNLGLQEVPLKGCGPRGGIIRNGEEVLTLGRLVERDAAAEGRGKWRAPHGAEADAIFADGRADQIAADIAAERAASNGRNVFWEGGPGGAASTPAELAEFGPAEARRRALKRAEQWRALPQCAQGIGWGCSLPFWAWTVTPDEYWSGPAGLSLAYEVWGYEWWYEEHTKTGLRDWALEVFEKYDLKPSFARYSEFWKREGKDLPRKFRWRIGDWRDNNYILTDEDECPQGGVEAGMVPVWRR